MATLMFKVFTLSVKTIAKPLASRFNNYVITHPAVRGGVISIAQRLHKLEVAISRGAEGKTEKVFIADMQEDKAVELASKVVSEGFIFSVGVLLLAWEYQRSRAKELEKRIREELHRKELREQAQQERQFLQKETKKQDDLIQALQDRMDKLEGRLIKLAGNKQKLLGIF
eukprot:TRINITY_DN34017_c0_g4_i1.p4 TRINITY_DN34017_c0_g4~~TRINITY_DN34017_c0_g4_i1.p4  ORF type:complete len:170 (+),score=16.58 TRINITY_DN34017_c0_g4_i1:56-565(+)